MTGVLVLVGGCGPGAGESTSTDLGTSTSTGGATVELSSTCGGTECGGGTTMPTTTTPTTTTDTSDGTDTFETTTGTTGASASTTGVETCVGEVIGNSSCGGATPYCVDGACVGCMDLSCPDVEPEKPACVGDLGLCVECQQSSDCTNLEQPACNVETATCEPCSSHDGCPETACNLETGECLPESDALYVDNTPDGLTPCSDQKPAPWGTSPEEPLCTLQGALSRLSEGTPTTIKIKAGSKPQNAPSAVPFGNFIVAIVHYGNTIPSLIPALAEPALTVSEGNTVFMSRVGVYNTNPVSDPLIACEGGAMGARLWIERQRIFSGRTAIRANNCRLHVRRSIITDNIFGGIELGGTDGALAGLSLENTYITSNGGDKFGAIRLTGVADGDIVHSTVALNKGPVAAIDCTNGWSGKLTIRNSAIVDPDPHFGPGCNGPSVTHTFESTQDNKGALGEIFSGFAEGRFQAKIGGLLEDVALSMADGPPTDHDGDPRPGGGSPDYAGADRPAL